MLEPARDEAQPDTREAVSFLTEEFSSLRRSWFRCVR